jgi:hypothetical protein
MPLDLAIDYNTGDLLIAPNRDIEVRTGREEIEQRIRVRLRVYGGEWELDPSGGQLGSRLHDAFRLPVWRSRREIPLIVREALEPMKDISVRDVIVDQDPDNPSGQNVTILYEMAEDVGSGSDILATTLTIEG